MIAEGVQDTEVTYTHGGDVYFVMPGVTRKAFAYYHQLETMTIVPAEMWDDTEHYFTCKNRTLHLFKEGDDADNPVSLGSYPRDVAVESDKLYNSDFLQCLATQTIKGRKRHVLYPMPDSCFLWNDVAVSKVKVATVSGSATDSAVSVEPLAASEVKDPVVTVVIPISDSTLVDAAVGMVAQSPDSFDDEGGVMDAALSLDQGGYLDGLTERKNDRSYDAIQDFLSTPDARLSQHEKRAVAVEKARTLYEDLHHVLGHRSREHTVRQIEWMYGKRMPPVVENMLEHCQACDRSKLTSDSYLQKALLAPTRPGEILSGDTIVDLPSSLSGYRYVIHISCVFSNYGAVWMTKTKVATKYAIFWLKHTKNLTGHGVAAFTVDLGEFYSDDMKTFCMDVGTSYRVGLAKTKQNMPIERRHRTLKGLQRALMNQGGAAGHMWEFAIPTANHILNLTIRINALKDAGRLGKGKLRPLTPFEQFVNHNKRVDIQALWRSLHHLFSLGVGYLQDPENHGNRAVLIVYLGYVCRNGSVDQHAHWGLVVDTRIVTKFRTVKTYGQYPWVPKIAKNLAPLVPLSDVDAETPPLWRGGGGSGFSLCS